MMMDCSENTDAVRAVTRVTKINALPCNIHTICARLFCPEVQTTLSRLWITIPCSHFVFVGSIFQFPQFRIGSVTRRRSRIYSTITSENHETRSRNRKVLVNMFTTHIESWQGQGPVCAAGVTCEERFNTLSARSVLIGTICYTNNLHRVHKVIIIEPGFMEQQSSATAALVPWTGGRNVQSFCSAVRLFHHHVIVPCYIDCCGKMNATFYAVSRAQQCLRCLLRCL